MLAEAVLYIATLLLINWLNCVVLCCGEQSPSTAAPAKHHRSEICKTLKVQLLIVQIQNNAMKDKTSDTHLTSSVLSVIPFKSDYR